MLYVSTKSSILNMLDFVDMYSILSTTEAAASQPHVQRTNLYYVPYCNYIIIFVFFYQVCPYRHWVLPRLYVCFSVFFTDVYTTSGSMFIARQFLVAHASVRYGRQYLDLSKHK